MVERAQVSTVLVTSVDDSSSHRTDDPDETRAALAAHDQVLRHAITSCGGTTFSHTSAGFQAVFRMPQAALTAAVTAQRTLELPVRMGIATDEGCAARIAAATRGGRIRLDGNTAALIARSLSEPTAADQHPLETLDFLDVAIRQYSDAATFTLMTIPLAVMADLFERLGHHDCAGTLCGFATNPWTLSANRELRPTVDRLIAKLGVDAYEALAAAGRATSPGDMAAYALMQIDLARAELE